MVLVSDLQYTLLKAYRFILLYITLVEMTRLYIMLPSDAMHKYISTMSQGIC
jgi:hypothetical protein